MALGKQAREGVVESYGVAYFVSPKLKEILGCCQDNGNHVREVLDGMQNSYPGRFEYRKMQRAKKRGRPNVYEIRMSESLIREIESWKHDDMENIRVA